MIIWGSRARDTQVATGTFFCPACQTSSAYSHQRVARYFTLYFIPLFPTQTLGEYVRCLRCAGEFKPFVVTLTRPQVEELVRPWQCRNCVNHNPAAETHCVSCGAPKGYVPPSAQPGAQASPESAAPAV